MPERLKPPNPLTGADRARFGAIGLGVVVAAACVLALGAPPTEQANRVTKVPGDGKSPSRTVASPRTAGYEGHGFPATAFEYAKMVEPQLGVPPRIDLGAGVEVPLYVDGIQKRGVLKSCDNPSRLGKGCISGSVLQRYEGRTRDGEPLPSVVWVSFGRNSSFAYRDKVHVLGSVQMIGYDEWTGATAFFESSDRIDTWADVDPETYRLTGEMPWIDDRQAFNRAFRTPGKGQCVECHQNDPFIHNSFIDAAKMPGTDDPVVPRIRTRDRNMRTDLPYHVLGGENWDMRTIHIEGNGCLDCHRIGMGTAMLFMRYGWHPNEHMPPKNPGSLSKDWEELLECWQNRPENTPGCDWVVPPTGDVLGQVVSTDYPHKAAFNQPGHEALNFPETGTGRDGLRGKSKRKFFGAKTRSDKAKQ